MGQPPYRHHLLAGAAFIVTIVAGEVLPEVEVPLLRGLGVALLLGSTALWIPPFAHLARHGAPEAGKGFHHTTRVVTRGLYGVVRHPQYLGYMLMTAGFVLTGLNAVSAAAGAVAVAAFYGAAGAEERFLLEHLGDDYGDYMAAVPGFDPVRGWLRRRRRRGGGISPRPGS